MLGAKWPNLPIPFDKRNALFWIRSKLTKHQERHRHVIQKVAATEIRKVDHAYPPFVKQVIRLNQVAVNQPENRWPRTKLLHHAFGQAHHTAHKLRHFLR